MLGIVLLNWNGGTDTEDALRSLRSADLPSGSRILVADNGSTDGSLSVIREKFPEVTLLENGANLGFAGGCNRGYQALVEAGAETIFFLNNDATVASDTITKLKAVLDGDSNIGAVSPRIFAGTGPESGTENVWFEKGITTLDRFSIAAHVPATDAERAAPFYETECVCGCALMIRAETMKQLGGFDEALFAYYEDADLSLRLRRTLGKKLMVVPSAQVWHKVSRSTGGEFSPTSAFYITRNGRRVARKNGTPDEWRAFQKQFLRAWLAQARYFARGGAAPFNEKSGGAALQGGLCALYGQTGLRPGGPNALYIAVARMLAKLP